MPERPEAIARLEALLGATLVAHEAIYDLRRDLVSAGAAEESAELLRESARIALERAPALASEARLLVRQWSDQILLDPAKADATARRLALEVERVEPELRALLARQVEIARELRARLGRGRG